MQQFVLKYIFHSYDVVMKQWSNFRFEDSSTVKTLFINQKLVSRSI